MLNVCSLLVPLMTFLTKLPTISPRRPLSLACSSLWIRSKSAFAIPSSSVPFEGRNYYHSDSIMQTRKNDYLIIGAGIFGATTALELRKTKSDSSVMLVDRSPFPSPSAASSDLNKIVRADYQNIFYMKLALDAQQLWRSDQTYKPYYHESGMLYAENKGMARDFLRNYELINHKAAAEILTVEQARLRWCGVFRQANWAGINETYFNPHSGWGEGDGALRSVIQAALDHGATYKQASVSNLVFNEDGSCKGVELEDGNGVHADHTIVATGAWTPWFLADSAPDRPSLHVGDRIITAGAIQCRAVYPYGEAQKLSEVPVIFNAQKHTEGMYNPRFFLY